MTEFSARLPTRVFFAALGAAVLAAPALAGQPEPWQMGMQPPATPVMERIQDLHGYLTIIITVIVVLVMMLLGWVMWRFRASRNPVASTRTHNPLLEVTWTAIPVAILAMVAVPSIDLLYFMDKAQKADMTLKVTGHQWYWSYEYPDHGEVAFDAFMIADEDLEAGKLRLLETDERVVLPVDTTVRVLLTSDDVIHSWAIPALGIKTDTVPGRTNETWLRITREGTYFGQCSELCGLQHGFMPVAIEAVSRPVFDSWIAERRAAAEGVSRLADGSRGR